MPGFAGKNHKLFNQFVDCWLAVVVVVVAVVVFVISVSFCRINECWSATIYRLEWILIEMFCIHTFIWALHDDDNNDPYAFSPSLSLSPRQLHLKNACCARARTRQVRGNEEIIEPFKSNDSSRIGEWVCTTNHLCAQSRLASTRIRICASHLNMYTTNPMLKCSFTYARVKIELLFHEHIEQIQKRLEALETGFEFYSGGRQLSRSHVFNFSRWTKRNWKGKVICNNVCIATHSVARWIGLRKLKLNGFLN